MSKSIRMLVAVALAAVALAGCAAPEEGDGTPTTTTTTPPATTSPPATTTPVTTPGNETPAPEVAVSVSKVPSMVLVGEPFTFDLSATSAEGFESDHVGAHFGFNTSEEASTAIYPHGCQHQVGAVPGDFVVTCWINQTGTAFLRGHVRLNVEGEEHNFWSDEREVVARGPVGNYTLTASGVPTLPVVAGSSFNFTLAIDGEESDFSDHIGAHWGANSSEEASTTAYPRLCVHQTGEVPGTFDVECEVPADLAPGTYYFRGHMRITVAGEASNFWTAAEHTFVVV